MEPDAVEIRVLGCLIEKQRTTPDAYPLTLNALRLACNQSTNRDPVVAYGEHEIREALDRLYRRRWTRAASGHGSRAAKFRQLLGGGAEGEAEDGADLAIEHRGELQDLTPRVGEPRLDALEARVARLESAIEQLVATQRESPAAQVPPERV